jgi:hypothetical protein
MDTTYSASEDDCMLKVLQKNKKAKSEICDVRLGGGLQYQVSLLRCE